MSQISKQVALKTSEYEALAFVDTDEAGSEALFGNTELRSKVLVVPPNRTLTMDLDLLALIEEVVGVQPSLVNDNVEKAERFNAYSLTPPVVPREQVLQHWEGRVLEIGKDEFVASLVDVSIGDNEETVEATLPLAELSDEDQADIEVGKIFNWVIGYGYSGTTKSRFSRLVFRRLPAWSEKELEEARKAGSRLSSAIRWD